MSNYQFFTTLIAGWIFHAFYAGMRRMLREIEHENRQRSKDRYYR